MTTIAYSARDGVMAGDTRAVKDGVIERGNYRKVFRLKDGTLLGFAGDVHDFQKTITELKKNPDATIPLKSELHAIRVNPDGTVLERDDGGWTQSEDAECYAIGSGRIPALVAMLCGKSPEEAVKMAMEFDPGTGGKVQTVSLK